MDPSARRRRLVVAAIVGVLLVAGVTLATLLHRSSAEPPTRQPEVIWVTPTAGPTAPPERAARLGKTTDPETFARLVGQTLFDWDTTRIGVRQQIVDDIAAVGDPSGESTPGLVADIESYLPPTAAWDELQRYSTRQRLEIRSMRVPTVWPEAQRQAGPEGFLRGTTAYTIHGIRHRSGTWEGRPVSSEHDVAFTVFIVCAPTYPECRLLRLSLPDVPLR